MNPSSLKKPYMLQVECGMKRNRKMINTASRKEKESL
jgi:hypothetical protein